MGALVLVAKPPTLHEGLRKEPFPIEPNATRDTNTLTIAVETRCSKSNGTPFNPSPKPRIAPYTQIT